MRILVLGGTVFLGRHVVERARARGHEVTIFQRGRTRPGLFPEVERILGDRDGGLQGLSGLAGGRWDAVIDTSGKRPEIVRQSAEVLSGAVERYVFISSASVYPLLAADHSETAPVLQPEACEEDPGARYGADKATSEAEVCRIFGDRSLIVRPGLIAGPFDPTGRATYWARRLARGGEILAPGAPDREVQLIDACDLAEWLLDCLERGLGGTFNASGPAVRLTLGELLAGTTATWVDDAFLESHGVGPWSELPLWIPPALGSLHVPIERALAAGLGARLRPVTETFADLRAWLDSGEPAETGERQDETLSAAREAGLLRLWHERGDARG